MPDLGGKDIGGKEIGGGIGIVIDPASQYRQKAEFELTPEELAVKLAMDEEWRVGCETRGRAFYLNPDGSRRQYTQQEFDEYQAAEHELWTEFYERSIAAGLYEEVSIEEQVAQRVAILESVAAELEVLEARAAERGITLPAREINITVGGTIRG